MELKIKQLMEKAAAETDLPQVGCLQAHISDVYSTLVSMRSHDPRLVRAQGSGSLLISV